MAYTTVRSEATQNVVLAASVRLFFRFSATKTEKSVVPFWIQKHETQPKPMICRNRWFFVEIVFRGSRQPKPLNARLSKKYDILSKKHDSRFSATKTVKSSVLVLWLASVLSVLDNQNREKFGSVFVSKNMKRNQNRWSAATGDFSLSLYFAVLGNQNR